MTIKRFVPLVLGLMVAVGAASPAFGVSKEIIQLQTQVQALSDQMARMQQSFDERMGVMKDLINQSVDNINKMSTSVDNLSKAVQQTNADNGSRSDQVSAQIQSLHDSVDELKARLAAVQKELDDMKAGQQNIPAAPAAQSQAPPPDVLYNNALRDYNAGKYQLAQSEFSDYLKYYGNTDLAGNAQFYVGDIDYKQGNFEQAVKEFDAVLEQYPGGNKSASAQLKKGFSLLELGQKDAGIRELRSLVARYPRSPERVQAEQRLRTLAANTHTRRTPARQPQ